MHRLTSELLLSIDVQLKLSACMAWHEHWLRIRAFKSRVSSKSRVPRPQSKTLFLSSDHIHHHHHHAPQTCRRLMLLQGSHENKPPPRLFDSITLYVSSLFSSALDFETRSIIQHGDNCFRQHDGQQEISCGNCRSHWCRQIGCCCTNMQVEKRNDNFC